MEPVDVCDVAKEYGRCSQKAHAASIESALLNGHKARVKKNVVL